MKTLHIALIASATIFAGSAQAQNAASLQDLIGARGSSGESELQSRGYEHISTSSAKGATHSFWWNGNSSTCVRVTTREGRYSNIVDRAALFCGKSAGASGGGHAANPVALHDIQGMRGVAAFDAMTERGFSNVDTITSGSTIYGIWYNRNTHQCIQVATAGEYVDSVTDIHTHPNCK